MIAHEHKCIFTHVPKTAGKAIRSLFGFPEFEKDFVTEHSNIEKAYEHRPLTELTSESFFVSYFKFSFVRNPYDRLVSAFFYMDNGGCHVTDRQFRDEHLAIYKSDFAAFVEGLPTLINTVHFRPQIVIAHPW